MKGFEIREEGFFIDGIESPLLFGEIHYFRLEPEYWGVALDKLKESGCNGVAFYIPWFLHEFDEGRFDFTGERNNKANLKKWLELIEAKDLFAFVRPGPFIYAESTNYGIPQWVSKNYRDVHLMRHENDEYTDEGLEHSSAHNNPIFIEKVSNWYERVIQEVKPYQYPKGKMVMIQACNEIPGEDIDDRNPINLGIGDENGIFPRFLKEKYENIEGLNKAYNSSFEKLIEVEPHDLEFANDKRAEIDHLEFYYKYYYPDYFKKLFKLFRENEINIPVIHNAYNPRAISLHYETKKQIPEINIGVDCYYSLKGRLGPKELNYYCEFGAEYIKGLLKNVPWVIEQESGYWNDYPLVYGEELYIWNIATFAAGYKGINMYLFAGGKNSEGMGFFGTDHNWQAPINQLGEEGESFNYIKDSLTEIRNNYDIFKLPRAYDLAFGISNSPGLIWRDISATTSEAYYGLSAAGYSPEIVDYVDMNLEELCMHKTLWVVSDAYMDKEIQEKLLNYVEQGGKLIVQGTMPYKDYSENTCLILSEYLGLKPGEHKPKNIDQQKLIYKGIEHYLGNSVQKIEVTDGEVLGIESREKGPAIIKISRGKGLAVVIPYKIDILFNSQCDYIADILKNIGTNPSVDGARRLKVIVKEENIAIAINIHPIKVKESISISGHKKEIEMLPYSYSIIKI